MTENAVGRRPAAERDRAAEHRARHASFAHMFAPGTRRHIHNALKAAATMEEIFEVLKLCVVQAVQVCNLGVPILEEELARIEGNRAAR